MKRHTTAFMTAALLAVAMSAYPAAGAKAKAKPKPKAPQAKLPNLDKALWIWDVRGALGAGRDTCYFRKTFDLPDKPAAATVLITADNCYDLYVNGSLVGSDAGAAAIVWGSVEKYGVAHLLAKGANVMAVRGRCLGGAAGLVAAARIEVKNLPPIEIRTDRTWTYAVSSETGWAHNAFDGSKWKPAAELGPMGIGPWGRVEFGKIARRAGGGARPALQKFSEPGEGFQWPAAVAFLSGRVGDQSTRLPQGIWRIGGSRAYLASDIPAPSVCGKRLYALRSVGAGGKPVLLADAGAGVIGSPSVSFDGKTIFFSMAPDGEKFFQVYRIAAAGGKPQALTRGPLHHYDPAELPDGRIVFSSTRLGSRDEYHANAGSCLFAMKPDGSDIQPITQHIVSDREPVVTANGLVAFVRCDNFIERAKVETQIHVVHPDGTAGQVWFGPDRGAIVYDRPNAAEQNSRWLRQFGYGSPAPLPDGQIAVLSAHGLLVSAGALDTPQRAQAEMRLFDISPLPDGRLLCTAAGASGIGVLDLKTGKVVRIDTGQVDRVHSAVYLGPRKRPPIVPAMTGQFPGSDPSRKTGLLYCQSVHNTRQIHADWDRVRAVRVYEGAPMTVRAGKHSYVHVGVEAVELGTAPLAPDGSFLVEVPADRALAIQAVDADGRAVVNELTWIYVRPGEQRSCVGCHAPRQSTPTRSGPVLAVRQAPIKLLGRGDPHRFRGNNAANGGVLNLQLDRFREAGAINLYSASADSPADETAALSAVLANRAAATTPKLSAARRLAVLRDRTAAGALGEALKDADANVRMDAALALSACGGRQAVAPLLKALDDSDVPTAQAAAMALENLTGHREKFNAYGRSAEREKGAKAWRAWVAANDWAAIEKSLSARLDDAKPTVRHAAIVSLGHVGTAEVGAAALRAMLKADKGTDLRVSIEAMRALGHLKDAKAIGLLKEIMLAGIKSPRGKGRGLHELGFWQAPSHRIGAAAEALGRIGTPAAEAALIDAFGRLGNFWTYTFNTGDHNWLMGCHSSVPHFRIIEALDRIGSKRIAPIAGAILKSVPMDADRGLLTENDTYEVLTARLIARAGLGDDVVATCLAVLGDAKAKALDALKQGVTASPPATTFRPYQPQSRAAEILSVVCSDAKYAPRIAAVFDRFRAEKPSRNRSWVCFYLARLLGKLGDRSVAGSLIAALERDATEASFGRPDPPNIFLHNAQTPCYRAAAAYALGRVGHKRAAEVLISAVENFENAMDVRCAAARGLIHAADASVLPRLRKLAADYPEMATRRALLAACAAAAGR